MKDMKNTFGRKELSAYVNAILTECAEHNIPVGNLKLQKLLYLCYGSSLMQGAPIQEGFKFEAWKYGPVVRLVYNEYQSYHNISVLTQKMQCGSTYPRYIGNSAVQYTMTHYANLSESKLIDLTHKEGGAWDKAFKQGINTPLNHQDIREDFTSGS